MHQSWPDSGKQRASRSRRAPFHCSHREGAASAARATPSTGRVHPTSAAARAARARSCARSRRLPQSRPAELPLAGRAATRWAAWASAPWGASPSAERSRQVVPVGAPRAGLAAAAGVWGHAQLGRSKVRHWRGLTTGASSATPISSSAAATSGSRSWVVAMAGVCGWLGRCGPLTCTWPLPADRLADVVSRQHTGHRRAEPRQSAPPSPSATTPGNAAIPSGLVADRAQPSVSIGRVCASGGPPATGGRRRGTRKRCAVGLQSARSDSTFPAAGEDARWCKGRRCKGAPLSRCASCARIWGAGQWAESLPQNFKCFD